MKRLHSEKHTSSVQPADDLSSFVGTLGACSDVNKYKKIHRIGEVKPINMAKSYVLVSRYTNATVDFKIREHTVLCIWQKAKTRRVKLH